jgi:hypothetical protein
MTPMRTDVHGLAVRQHDMFGQPQDSFELPMTQAEIHAELTRIVDELRAAQSMPWDIKEMQRNSIMFPDMASRLSPADAATLITAFETEMRRLRG